MLKKYLSFIKENYTEMNSTGKGKLFIESGDDTDVEWSMTIDVSKIWQDYENKKISLVDFNNQYASFLINKSQEIYSTIGDSCWNDLEPVLVDELRKSIYEDESEKIYEKIYDICDKYMIELNCGNIEVMTGAQLTTPTPTDKPATQPVTTQPKITTTQ